VSAPNPRARYLADSIATASPARLLVMLYDRLALDLSKTEDAFRDGRPADASATMENAQEIVFELKTTLKLDVWEHAGKLDAIYTWLISELVGANIKVDADRVKACRTLVEELRDAFRQAAMSAAGAPTPNGSA
jgi:flagellar protein FliS